MALSKASGPSSKSAGDLAAFRHLAQGRRFDGRGDFGRHRLDRRKDGHSRHAHADRHPEIDGVLDDVALGIEIGKDVDRRIGDEQRIGMARHIHHEDMADPPPGAKPRRGGGDLMHQFICVEAPLHQQFALALADEFHRLRRGGMAVRHVDDLAWPARSIPCLAATARILASGPTSIGRMSLASAASRAPRKDVSSQGCATIVGTGGFACAAAISRSYFDAASCTGLASQQPVSLLHEFCLRCLAARRHGPGFQVRSARSPTRNSDATRSSRWVPSSLRLPRAPTTSFSSRKRSPSLFEPLRQHGRDRGQCCLFVDEEHEILLADQAP